MKKEHLLIMRFSAIGDVVMMVPVVVALAEQYPSLKITVLSRPFAKDFFSNLAPNVYFMSADVKGEYKGVGGLNELFKRVYSKNITCVADFHGVLRTEYLRSRFAINGIKVEHINKHRKGRRKLCRQKNKVMQPLASPFDNYSDVLSKLGYPIVLNQEKVPFASLPSSFVVPKEETWIGIAPGASYLGKIYPSDKMQEVIEILKEDIPNSKIFIFGEKENPYPETTNVHTMCDGFRSELALMKKLKVMISMDSANMHLASLVGTPVVSVWGQTHPLAGFIGWNQTTDTAVQLDLPCRPCSIFGNKKCEIGDYPCIKNITPEQIVDKVMQIVNR
ncbi:MAG: glycosyltransferase family 9 protein [Prevotella sp.]|nr:glycosyltransferase family 9 protein [Candidatus Equicola stercoris]